LRGSLMRSSLGRFAERARFWPSALLVVADIRVVVPFVASAVPVIIDGGTRRESREPGSCCLSAAVGVTGVQAVGRDPCVKGQDWRGLIARNGPVRPRIALTRTGTGQAQRQSQHDHCWPRAHCHHAHPALREAQAPPTPRWVVRASASGRRFRCVKISGCLPFGRASWKDTTPIGPIAPHEPRWEPFQ
jgi:hypothetical protein